MPGFFNPSNINNQLSWLLNLKQRHNKMIYLIISYRESHFQPQAITRRCSRSLQVRVEILSTNRDRKMCRFLLFLLSRWYVCDQSMLLQPMQYLIIDYMT